MCDTPSDGTRPPDVTQRDPKERKLVDQNSASWNRIVVWLRQLGQWQEAGLESPAVGPQSNPPGPSV